MNLEFKILWFENQFEQLESQIEELKELIKSEGFIPIIEQEKDASNLEQLRRRQEDLHEFDLVVVDYNLDGESKGDTVAKEVRRHFGFTDILFYSGLSTRELQKLMYEKSIEGVYCVTRTRLIGRLEELIEDIVAKLSRLGAMRGLAVSIVGQCDSELKGIISSLLSKLSNEKQIEFCEFLDNKVEESRSAGIKNYQKCSNLEDRLESRSVTSFTLWKAILELTKDDNTVNSERSILKNYNKEVLSPRNGLGHAVETIVDGKWFVEIANGTQITKSEFKNLRESLARHSINISCLKSKLI